MTKVICLSPEQEALLERAGSLIHLLKPREAVIARLAASGLSAKEVATQLGSTQKTVERYIERIVCKARLIYGPQATFRGIIAAELSCFYFIERSL